MSVRDKRESFLNFIVERSNKYTAKDKKYKIVANPTTIRRFGPSGSLNNKNVVLENKREVTPNMINEIFFELEYIVVIIQEKLELIF